MPAMSSAPKRQRIDTAQADQNGVIKQEPKSPAKMPCLNQSLIVAKVEPEKTPERQAAPAEPLFGAPAAPAAAAMPAQAAKKALWQQLLTKTPSKLVLSLSSPTPPRGITRKPDELSAPVHVHAKHPPPLPGFLAPLPLGCSSRPMSSTGMLAEPSPAEPAQPQDSIGGTHTPRPPPSNIRGSKTSEMKKVHNAFAHQARYLTPEREPELYQHLQDLKKEYASGHRCILEFKRLIAECRKGRF